jgi:hypothetical protein
VRRKEWLILSIEQQIGSVMDDAANLVIAARRFLPHNLGIVAWISGTDGACSQTQKDSQTHLFVQPK